VPQGSPLSIRELVQLFIAPSEYFAAPRRLRVTPQVWIAAYLTGITVVMNRIDVNLTKADFSIASPFTTMLAGSWMNYWIFVVLAGGLGAWYAWFLGGWWYQVRLRWSGARDVAAPDARAVYVYQDFVESAPWIVVTLVQFYVYPNYAVAWSADELWSSTVIVFMIWSCATSYKAAVSGFSVSRWKARLWFLILPLVFYSVTMGVTGMLYAMLGGAEP